MQTKEDLKHAEQGAQWRRQTVANIRSELDLAIRTHGSLEAAAKAGRDLQAALDEPFFLQYDQEYRKARTALRAAEKAKNRCRSLKGWGDPTPHAQKVLVEYGEAKRAFREAASRLRHVVYGRPALKPYVHLFQITERGFHSPVAAAKAHAVALQKLSDLPAALARAEEALAKAEAEVEAVRGDLISDEELDAIRFRLPQASRTLLLRMANEAYSPKPKTVDKHRKDYNPLIGFGLVEVSTHDTATTKLGRALSRFLKREYLRPTKKNARAWKRPQRAIIGRNLLEVWKDPKAAETDEEGLVEVGPDSRYSIKLYPRRSLLEGFLDVFRPGWREEIELPPLPAVVAEARVAS